LGFLRRDSNIASTAAKENVYKKPIKTHSGIYQLRMGSFSRKTYIVWKWFNEG
jgi:hypothetical protein